LIELNGSGLNETDQDKQRERERERDRERNKPFIDKRVQIAVCGGLNPKSNLIIKGKSSTLKVHISLYEF
jgi:hypothetical protein